MPRLSHILLPILLTCYAAGVYADAPRYKPSSSSPAPQDITSNAYGFSRNAPEALSIGELAPNFALPQAGGGEVRLAQVLTDLQAESGQPGAVILIFYRGHW